MTTYIGNRPTDTINVSIGVQSGTSLPASGNVGELFFNTSNQELYVFDGANWDIVSSSGTGVSVGTTLPTSGDTGDLFFQTSDEKLYVWDGSLWVPLIGAEFGTALPTTGEIAEFFYVTSTQTLYIWNGTAWNTVGSASIVDSGATTPASGQTAGQLFFNTTSTELLVWNGSAWVVVTTPTGISVPTGATLPTSAVEGELFFNTTDDAFYVYQNGAWVNLMPGQTNTGSALPASASVGEIFFDTSSDDLYVYDGTDWIIIGGASVNEGVVVGNPLPTTGNLGDLFFQTSDSKLYVWNGTVWVSLQEGGSGVTVGTTLPSSGSSGDLFYQTSDDELYVYSDGGWVSLQDQIAEFGTTFPLFPATGLLFYNTTDSTLYLYNGTAWVPLSGSGVPNAQSGEVIGYNATTTLQAAFTAPQTTGKRYVLSSIHVANITTQDETITGEIFYSNSGDLVSIGNQIPVPAGSALELMSKTKILNPSDELRLQASSNGTINTIVSYNTTNNTNLFGTGIILTTSNVTTAFVATTKSRIDSILVANVGQTDYTVNVQWTNGQNALQAYVVFNFVVPANSTVELISNSMNIPASHRIRAEATDPNVIEIHVSGEQS